MSRLHVFAGQQAMGWFGFMAGDYFFEYEPEWRVSRAAFPLSPAFPLAEARFSGPSVKFFFKNLLPEGPVLEAIALEKGLALDNLLEFFAELGKDCPGVISLLPEGQLPAIEQHYEALLPDDLRQRIADRARHPLIKSRDDASMSLAGAQDKMGVRYDPKTHRLWEPVGGSPSTHILKPENRNPDFVPTVINEYLCMRLARRMKLPVPTVYLERLPDPVLIIERYDRHVANDQVTCQHQIDFCQLLNKDGFFKYERNGHLIGLMEVFQQTALFVTPGVARLRLVDWVIFNYLIGNADAHAKNLSALVSEKGLELAPVYDLLSVTPYGDDRLALYIGYAETFEAVTLIAWAEFCEDCQLSLPAFRKRLAFMSSRIVQAFTAEVAALGPLPDEEMGMVNRIHAEISKFSGYAQQSLS
jgi:serine/threonine-protein kinase HipA